MFIPIRGSMSLFPNDELSSTVYLLTFPLAALLCASLLPPSPHYKFGVQRSDSPGPFVSSSLH